jgi:hypothetical protein
LGASGIDAVAITLDGVRVGAVEQRGQPGHFGETIAARDAPRVL